MSNKIEELKKALRAVNEKIGNDVGIELMNELLNMNVDEIIKEEDFQFFIDKVEAELKIPNVDSKKLMELLKTLREKEGEILNQKY